MIFVMHGPLRRLMEFKKQVQITGDTVQEGLDALCVAFPELESALLDSAGRVRGVHRVALNRSVLSPEEMTTPVTSDDVVDVITALAGG